MSKPNKFELGIYKNRTKLDTYDSFVFDKQDI